MAGDGTLLVNFAALQGASGDIAKAVSKLQNSLSQLERDGARLSGTWDGEAKQAYAARQTKWQNASQDLQQILSNIKKAVDESAQDYIHTEKQATNRFS
ncbi:WXG100 family type VII secretion target [Actinoplanes sp. NPDC026619]|uniref:WXG100 family type VII secretion target n=1 Tax=Actinoplanes sp. NPDC026619 TaxID=3155798 RepID=UPI0033D072B5